MMPLNCVISRPSRKLRRRTSASVKATAPELISPRSHRSTLNPAIVTIIRPESSAIEARTPVMNRVKRSTVSWIDVEALRACSGRSPRRGRRASASGYCCRNRPCGRSASRPLRRSRANAGGCAARNSAQARQSRTAREARPPQATNRAGRPAPASSRIDADEPDALHQRGHEIADRLPGRPDLGDDAAGKIVLEEVTAIGATTCR